jgi:glucosamine kinase
MSSKYFLGIDAGSSATKWAVVDEAGNQIVHGKTFSVDGHLYREESRERWATFLKEIQNKVEDTIVAIYAGVTGASDFEEENQELINLISRAFPHSKVSVVMDVALGYRANIRDSRGIYIYAGTGSIAVYQDAIGGHRTVGGWGYLLGDEGAGYWIGISALREILFEIERNNFDSRLKEVMFEKDVTPTFARIKELVYGAPRGEVAALAKLVIELSRAGDQKALAILHAAAQHLTGLVLRTRDLVGSDEGPVVFGGGIARYSDEIVKEMERLLNRPIQVSSDDLSLEAARFAWKDTQTTN